MSRKTKFFTLIIFLFILAGGLWYVNDYYSNLPERISQHETIVLAQDHLVPGSDAAMRVVVRDTKDAAPLAGATGRERDWIDGHAEPQLE